MDCSLPGSSVHGILQARILEWVAMPSSRGFSRPRDQAYSLGALHCRQILYQLSYLQETQVQSLDGEDPWRREWQTTPVFLPGECHGQRSLAGYCPWVIKSWTQLSGYQILYESVIHFELIFVMG